MNRAVDPRLSVRRVRADEWREVRALRLAATADPDAGIAFLETHASAAARGDEFWQVRTTDAADGDTAAQFIASLGDEQVGSVVVLVRATGQTDHLGRFVDDRRADVVGVWVRPDARGSGAIDLLLSAAADWVRSVGLRRVHLDVHRDNARAQAAYRRAGFIPTGETLDGPIGPEIVMARDLPVAR